MKRIPLVFALAAAAVCAACASSQQEEPAKARDVAGGSVPVAGRGTSAVGSGSGSGTAGVCPTGCETPPPGCNIKGNINLKTGERVYHVPGQKHYDNVTIEPSAGERWFCTEAEAESSGWRRSRR